MGLANRHPLSQRQVRLDTVKFGSFSSQPVNGRNAAQ